MAPKMIINPEITLRVEGEDGQGLQWVSSIGDLLKEELVVEMDIGGSSVYITLEVE